MEIKESIKKLQGLPEKHKKIILWVIIAIIGIIFLIFWLNSVDKSIQKINTAGLINSLNVPADIKAKTEQVQQNTQQLLNQAK